MIRFTIVKDPKGQMRARHGVVKTKKGKHVSVTYKDEKQRNEEDSIHALAYRYKPDRPLEGAIVFGVRAYLRIPQSFSKKKREQALSGEIRPTTKPDLDNITKNLKDVFNGVFWTDDKHVVEYLPGHGKYYGDPPRMEIGIVTLEEWKEMKAKKGGNP